MALVGNMIFDAVAGDPSIVNYAMFVAVFSMLSLFYLVAATVKDLTIIPWLPLVVDALNMIFFLVGGIALAADLKVHSCSNAVRLTQQSWLPIRANESAGLSCK